MRVPPLIAPLAAAGAAVALAAGALTTGVVTAAPAAAATGYTWGNVQIGGGAEEYIGGEFVAAPDFDPA